MIILQEKGPFLVNKNFPPSHPRYCLSNYTSEAMSHDEDSWGGRCRQKHLNILHESVAKFIVPDSGIKSTLA
jgi:hypothetical protein